jgi:hypothetical protein
MKAMRVVAIAAVLSAPYPALADECGDAVLDYNAVLPRLEDATQKFSACVANSLGVDSCSKEYSRLQAVFGEFQSVVFVYRKQCR